MARHRHQGFIRFLNAVEREVPAGKVIHAIVDNYAAHKHPKVLRWLTRHPRFVFHFTPTSGAWLNAVLQHHSSPLVVAGLAPASPGGRSATLSSARSSAIGSSTPGSC